MPWSTHAVPDRRAGHQGHEPGHGRGRRASSDVKAPFSALAFKIMTDPFVGKLLPPRVLGPARFRLHRVQRLEGQEGAHRHLLQIRSNQRVDIGGCAAGDIVAVVGLKDTSTGDTVRHDHPIILSESMEFAEPVIDIAVEPKTKAELRTQDGHRAAKLAEEDPFPRVHQPGRPADHHRRHGASCTSDHRRPPAASSRSRRTWANLRSPTARQPRRKLATSGASSCASPAVRPVRPCGHPT